MSKIEKAAGVSYPTHQQLILPEEMDLLKQARQAREEKEVQETINQLIEAEKTKQQEINEKIEKLEIKPFEYQMFVLPYPVNPYRKLVEGNIIVDYRGSFMNPDTGEQDTLHLGIGCGKVIAVGSKCEWVKEGDDIYYDTRGSRPCPFMDFGWMMVHEKQTLAYMNEGIELREEK